MMLIIVVSTIATHDDDDLLSAPGHQFWNGESGNDKVFGKVHRGLWQNKHTYVCTCMCVRECVRVCVCAYKVVHKNGKFFWSIRP